MLPVQLYMYLVQKVDNATSTTICLVQNVDNATITTIYI